MGIGETPGTLFPLIVRCLSIHADYACRHSGACCNAGWPIPIDEVLRRRMGRDADAHLFSAVAETVRVPVFPACEFFEADTHLCAIHGQLGPEDKPAPCRHFPRVALLDPRGVSLTLSHFCPTAASLLFRDDVTLRVVENPPSFARTDEYEGLDARDVMPPLLRPGMLWDLEGYSEWETHAVAMLARPALPPEAAVERLRAVAARIEQWRPGRTTLTEYVKVAFSGLQDALTHDSSKWGDHARVVNRYLAARLFASWVPYRADHLSALIDDLERTLGILRQEAARAGLLEAIRAADLRIVHGQC